MSGISFFIIVFLVICLYFLPTVNAVRSKKTNSGAILLLNLFLGWTFLGWVIALVWSATKDQNQAKQTENNK